MNKHFPKNTNSRSTITHMMQLNSPINDSKISITSFLVLSSCQLWLKFSWHTMFLKLSCRGFRICKINRIIFTLK